MPHHRVPAPAVPVLLLWGAMSTAPVLAALEPFPGGLPAPTYHLTARPWKALQIPRGTYLDRIEGAVRFMARHQDATGAIIDPVAKRECQYATPYFANALATLAGIGRVAQFHQPGPVGLGEVPRAGLGGRLAQSSTGWPLVRMRRPPAGSRPCNW